VAGGLHTLFSPILKLGELAYRAVLDKRNASFDSGKGVTTFDRPVISVGNISVGGTGKTPMVHWVARELIASGRSPVIAMRGYGARDGEKSDEQIEHERRLPGVPVVARPDRTAALIEFFGTGKGEAADTIILDDGFQHRKVARQLDIVLIDAGRDPFEDQCLPAGRLREPVASLSRADAVVLTHCETTDPGSIKALRSRLGSHISQGKIFETRHDWTGVWVTSPDGQRHERSVADAMSGKRVVALSAIGRPGPFEERVRAETAEAQVFRLRDHHPLDEAPLAPIRNACEGADALVCTAKDWAKLSEREPFPVDVIVPRLELRFDHDHEEHLRALVIEAAGAALE